jgi:hypothetical protein
MARLRRRRAKGFTCLTIQLHSREIDRLIARQQRLDPEARADRETVRRALYRFLEDHFPP